jgi:DNA-binding NarL/FixJ family response regulator
MARDIQIVVIGKTNLVRDGVWALLRAQEGMAVLTVIESDVEAIKSVVVRPIPDVAVMHFPIVTPSGLDAVAAVRRRWPAARVIALTAQLDGRVASTTTEAGVDGCISESDSPMELLSAIRTAAKGERYVTRSHAGKDISVLDKLTEREKQVTRMIAVGYRTREIAQRLSLSAKTVEKHRGSVMRKLGLRSAAAVAAYAVTHSHLIL